MHPGISVNFCHAKHMQTALVNPSLICCSVNLTGLDKHMCILHPGTHRYNISQCMHKFQYAHFANLCIYICSMHVCTCAVCTQHIETHQHICAKVQKVTHEHIFGCPILYMHIICRRACILSACALHIYTAHEHAYVHMHACALWHTCRMHIAHIYIAHACTHWHTCRMHTYAHVLIPAALHQLLAWRLANPASGSPKQLNILILQL